MSENGDHRKPIYQGGFPATIEDWRLHLKQGGGNYGMNILNEARMSRGEKPFSPDEFFDYERVQHQQK